MAYEEATLGILGLISAALVAILVWLYRLQSGLKATQKEITEKISPISVLSGVATGLQTSISGLQTEIGDIKQQAERIATLGEKYQTTETLTRTIHSILIGSYSKGKSGEQVLRQMMGELARAGLVESSVPFGTKVVEYAVKFDDGKMLAIDSKIVATAELDQLHGDEISEGERNEIANQLVSRIRGKIDEVAAYIDPGRTVPFAVMAIPDSMIEYGTSLIGEASRRNVIILGYSSVPPLIEYFYKVHSAYTVQQDAEAIYESLARVNTSLSKFTDSYFANRFSKPLKVMTTAAAEIQDGIRRALLSASSEQIVKPELEEPPLNEGEVAESEGKEEQNPFRDYDKLPKT